MRYCGCDTFGGAILKREVLKEARLTLVGSRPHNFLSYTLEMELPGSGEKTVETHATMPAVVNRAAQLIQAGYHIAISSSATRFVGPSARIGQDDY